ncbi:hypothetical protein L7F22_039680 [Adiantum nelumboides]|nr:hypothetical protein [Adiantum nelumboides]
MEEEMVVFVCSLLKDTYEYGCTGFLSLFCSSGLPSDVVIEVEQTSFHLHKFPLVSRSQKLAFLMEEHLEEEPLHVHLREMPGGPDVFVLAAKFCYGIRLELTAANVVSLRCAAEYLEMTEEFGEANLIAVTEGFLSQIVLRNWKECTRALQSCERVLPASEKLGIVTKCVDALTLIACTSPSLQGWPMPLSSMQSPGGSLLWNGISTGARPKKARSDWWYEDISMLSLPLYERVIEAMKQRGIKPENIAGALVHFARRYLPALNKRQSTKDGSGRYGSLSLSVVLSKDEQRVILEFVERLLPMQKALVSTRFLSGLLRSTFILNASPDCRSNIERRIGLQLDQTNLEDLLLPNLTYNLETLYDIDCVQRILDHFLLLDQYIGGTLSFPNSDNDGPVASSPSLTPMVMVARLMDGFLGEVAPDVNLKPSKFQSLAEALPEFARVSDDGLYRAIDIYLKAHPWLKEGEREELCRLMDCRKLSLEACAHAAQNERLPLRAIVQVLFFEQLQLRTAIASCFMISDSSRPLRNQSTSEAMPPAAALMRGEGWANALRDNQALKVNMDQMKLRVSHLERECSGMRKELEKIGRVRGHWNLVSKSLGGRFKTHICRTRESAVQDQTCAGGASRGVPSTHSRQSHHRRSSSLS